MRDMRRADSNLARWSYSKDSLLYAYENFIEPHLYARGQFCCQVKLLLSHKL